MLLQLFNAKIETKLKTVKALFYYYVHAVASMVGGAGLTIPHPGFGRIEVAATAWWRAAFQLAHPALDSY